MIHHSEFQFMILYADVAIQNEVAGKKMCYVLWRRAGSQEKYVFPVLITSSQVLHVKIMSNIITPPIPEERAIMISEIDMIASKGGFGRVWREKKNNLIVPGSKSY